MKVEEAVDASPERQEGSVSCEDVWIELQMRWHVTEMQEIFLFLRTFVIV